MKNFEFFSIFSTFFDIFKTLKISYLKIEGNQPSKNDHSGDQGRGPRLGRIPLIIDDKKRENHSQTLRALQHDLQHVVEVQSRLVSAKVGAEGRYPTKASIINKFITEVLQHVSGGDWKALSPLLGDREEDEPHPRYHRVLDQDGEAGPESHLFVAFLVEFCSRNRFLVILLKFRFWTLNKILRLLNSVELL